MSVDNTNIQASTSAELCNQCQTFYGSSCFDGLCSKCYKYHIINLVPIEQQLKTKKLPNNSNKRHNRNNNRRNKCHRNQFKKIKADVIHVGKRQDCWAISANVNTSIVILIGSLKIINAILTMSRMVKTNSKNKLSQQSTKRYRKFDSSRLISNQAFIA